MSRYLGNRPVNEAEQDRTPADFNGDVKKWPAGSKESRPGRRWRGGLLSAHKYYLVYRPDSGPVSGHWGGGRLFLPQ